MKRILVLLLPFVAIAVAAPPENSKRVSREETIGLLWQESVNSGNTDAAMEKLVAFTKAGGDQYMANLRAAYLNYNAQKYDEATRFYITAGKLQPGALSPRLGLFNIAVAKGDAAATAAASDGVLRVDPNNYSALMTLAWGAFQKKDYRLSGRSYERVLALYPEDLDALSGAAWSAFYSGKSSDAKRGFTRLMSLDPNHAFVREGIAATSR